MAARIQPINTSSPPAKESKSIYDAIQKKMGRVPNTFSLMGNAPQVLEAWAALNKCAEATSIPPATRELISLAVSEANSSQYCLSAHTQLAQNLRVSDSDISKARKADSSDKKTQAFLRLAQRIVEKRGHITDSEFQDFRRQGLSEKEILETVLVVTACSFANYFNDVAQTPNDFPAVPSSEMAGAR
jgi:uncharacterized peroxidase-related enzyme